MKKKRIGAVAILAGILCFSLCGCGGQTPEDQTPDGHTFHSYGAWETVTQPTCTTQGSRQRVCKCGEKQTEAIPATGHKGGDYSSDGQYHWKSCTVCGETYQKGEHDFEGGACKVCELKSQITVEYSFELNEDGDGYILTGVGDGNYFPALRRVKKGHDRSSYYSNPFTGCTALNELEISAENKNTCDTFLWTPYQKIEKLSNSKNC